VLENIFKYFGGKPATLDLSESNVEFNAETISEFNKDRSPNLTANICNAPFNSLYFGHEGKVCVCCHSRYYEIGRYPKENISDILKGKRLEILKSEMSKYYLGPGCAVCKNQILAGGHATVKAKQYDQFTIRPDGYPTFMEFELSNTCNLECEMCTGVFSSSIRKNREKLPPIISPYDQAFVDQLSEYIPHLERANFLGGEPFLINVYYDIWDKIVDIKPKLNIYVQTNGTVLNNRVKQLLEKGNFSIGVSLDSLQKDTYEMIRKNAKFDTVYENVQWYKDYCKRNGSYFGISVCAMPQNWTELPDMVRFANENEFPIFFNTVLDPKHMSFDSLREMQLDEIIAVYEKVDLPNESILEKKNRTQLDGVLKRLKHLKTKVFPTIYKAEDLQALLLDALKAVSGGNDATEQKMIIDKLSIILDSVGTEHMFKLLNQPTHHDRSSRTSLILDIMLNKEAFEIVDILKKIPLQVSTKKDAVA
jgi:molybdenum cofactor biosynthesis enzyme MoaA